MNSNTDFLHSATFLAKQKAKLKHIEACLLPESQYNKSAGFETISLENQSAAGFSLADVSLDTEFLSRKIRAPLMIAPMTGGTEQGAILNARWARAAESFGIPFGVGSQSLALKKSEVASTYQVRKIARSALIFANLGAGQIIENGSLICQRAVEMIEADALFIHLNPLQEACQERGDTNFFGLVRSLTEIVNALSKASIPVLVREVGFGLSESSVRILLSTGITGIDCAGAGGTSWTKVEGLVAASEKYRRLAEVFGEWGIPTVESIRNVRKVNKNIPLIASGGIRTGLDVAKAVAIGADVAGMARPMLCAALKSEEELFSFIEQILLELRVAMFGAGVLQVRDLRTCIT